MHDAATIAEKLTQSAAERFGPERAAELREALQVMAAEIQAIQTYPLGVDDEP
jgi:hypothetical protein